MATSLTSGNAMNSLSGTEQSKSDKVERGYIMIETNYRVYAYTSSSLQIAILSLFISLQTRFANMVVGLITRESIREALNRGISADQVSFLR
jgi:transcription initiation factor TFIIH subunit 4